MEVSTLTQKAEQLHELRRQIARLDEIHEQETEPLIADMNTGGVKSLKVSTGETFTKAVRQSVAIVNEFFALEWVKENQAVKVDTALVA